MKRRFFTILLCFLCYTLWATEVPKVYNYLIEESTSFNQVWSIAQAPNGFVYFATTGGLMEFDGCTWSKYRMPKGQIVRSTTIDSSGRIFVGGFEELGFWQFDEKSGLSYESMVEKVPNSALDKEEIWNILINNDQIYFQSFSQIFKHHGDSIRLMNPPFNIMFAKQIGNDITVPMIAKGLYQIDDQDRFLYIDQSDYFKDKMVETIIEVSPKTFLIGTQDDGIYFYKNGQFSKWNERLNSFLSKYKFNRGIRLRNGNFVIGTLLNGIIITDANGNPLHHLNRTNGLQNNTILSLLEDQSGKLWVGTDNGIDLVSLNEPLYFYKDQFGLLGTVYTAAVFEQNLYLGTNQGLFFRPVKATDEDFVLLDGTQGQVWQLIQIGSELICGHNEGTFGIQNNEVRKISTVTGGWNIKKIPDSKNLYIQGTYTGLVLYELDESKRIQFKSRIGGFAESSKMLVFDSLNRLWVAHARRGLFAVKLNKKYDSVVDFKDYSLDQSLPTQYDLSIQVFQEKLIVRSGSQFLAFNYSKDQFETSMLAPLKSTSPPFKLLTVGSGDYFKVYNNNIEWYNQNDSVYPLDLKLVNDNPFVLDLSDNRFLFCLKNGYSIFEPYKNKANPTISLSDIFIKKISSSNTLHYINEKIKSAFFEANDNNLTLTYACTSFGKSPKFSYFLEGFSKNWSSYSDQTEQVFTNLSSGDYVFKVRSNVIPNRMASIQISIAPFWYETTLAKIGLVIILLLLLFGLYKWHQYRLEQIKQAKEKQLQEERIKSKNEKLQAEVVGKSKELANSTINLVKKVELLEKIKGLLDQLKKENQQVSNQNPYQKLQILINQNISNNEEIALFETNFDEINEQFYKKLKDQHPNLTPGDMRLAAYLKMNLATKEIAPLLNISIRGVENKRYRLRKKMDLSPEENLTEYMMQI
ncbi:MAG: two-component regulator propeller domain-containing protein [Bacteroidota bacterium]